VLTGVNRNKTIIEMPDGSTIAGLNLDLQLSSVKRRYDAMCGLDSSKSHNRNDYIRGGAKVKQGYQLRYIYFLDKKYKDRLTVPILPFSKIDEMGAGMYKGENVTQAERHAIKTEK
jgi:hypothetical protein